MKTIMRYAAAVGFLLAACSAASGASREAFFAGGCFWCVEEFFEEVPGVVAVVSGYTGGTKRNPTYEEVSAGGTGHVEAVRVTYDPAKVTYRHLLDVFWRNIDPTDGGGQFCDRGSQYRSAIFFADEEQRNEAERSREALRASRKLPASVATGIFPAKIFYPAEEYHQDYHRKNPIRYKFYRTGCGRDSRLNELWGKKR